MSSRTITEIRKSALWTLIAGAPTSLAASAIAFGGWGFGLGKAYSTVKLVSLAVLVPSFVGFVAVDALFPGTLQQHRAARIVVASTFQFTGFFAFILLVRGVVAKMETAMTSNNAIRDFLSTRLAFVVA
jgi:hypothetical protein